MYGCVGFTFDGSYVVGGSDEGKSVKDCYSYSGGLLLPQIGTGGPI